MIVDLEPTEDQAAIAEGFASLLSDRLPVSRLREADGHGGQAERAIWDELSGLGLFGLGVAEADGGLGLGLPEEMLAARALGVHLVSPSVLAQAVAAHLATSGQRAGIIAGETRVAFGNRTAQGHIQLIDGEGADLVLIVGRGAVLIEKAALGAGEDIASLDETIRMARHALSEDGARDEAADRVSLLVAAYLGGIASAVTDMAVDYAKTREQFGQPIGAFQAIKHMCADMIVRAHAADAQTRHAAVMFGMGGDDAREIAAARLLAADAALANAKANIQIHGGMGFTAECDAHLFLKRAHLMSVLGSSRRAEERRIVAEAV